jgi:hypothetical protein
MKDIDEWHKIGDKLTSYFGICNCQRKLKSIIDALYSIYVKCQLDTSDPKRQFTGAEWLLIALIDSASDRIEHGVSCEYPIIIENHPFWQWIVEIKDSPYLEDN